MVYRAYMTFMDYETGYSVKLPITSLNRTTWALVEK